jgi:hypothetical protein
MAPRRLTPIITGVDAELAGGAGDALGGAVGDRPHRQEGRALALRDAMGEQQRLAAFGIRLVGGAADEEAGPLLDVDRIDGRAAAAALAAHGLAHQQRVRTAQRHERGRRVELTQILRVVEADDLRHFLGHHVRRDDALVGAPADERQAVEHVVEALLLRPHRDQHADGGETAAEERRERLGDEVHAPGHQHHRGGDDADPEQRAALTVAPPQHVEPERAQHERAE